MNVDDAWVVMTCRDGVSQYWAWCRPNRHSPGFDEIFYTTTDGITAYSPEGGSLPGLMDHVFTIAFAPEEVASTGSRFPEHGRELAPDEGWRPAAPTLEPAESDAGGG
jgi:hypothetical protein